MRRRSRSILLGVVAAGLTASVPVALAASTTAGRHHSRTLAHAASLDGCGIRDVTAKNNVHYQNQFSASVLCDQNMMEIQVQVCAQKEINGTFETQQSTCEQSTLEGAPLVDQTINPACAKGTTHRAFVFGYAKDYNNKTWSDTTTSAAVSCKTS